MSDQPAPLDLESALALIAGLPPAVRPAVVLPLDQAVGHVLAADLPAPWPLPRFTNAAVDGWAVRLRDCASAGPTCLPIGGRIIAGDPPLAAMTPGSAIRIMTGAPLPPGADAVVMQEVADEVDGMVLLPAGLRHGQHVRREGEQAARGDVLLRAGQRLDAAAAALAASTGVIQLPVHRPVRVALLSTGNEVWPIGSAPPAGGILDANGVMLAALLRTAGAKVVAFAHVRDEAGALLCRLAEMAAGCDLVVTTGGVSVGEEDHLREAVIAGGRLLFWRLAVKPGRPTAMGVIGHVPLLALPGNPAAAFTMFHVLGLSLLRHLAGPARTGGEALHVPPLLRSGFARASSTGISEIVPVTVGPCGDIQLVATTHGVKGTLAELAAAEGLALLGPSCSNVVPGDHLPVVFFHPAVGSWVGEAAGQAETSCL